MVLQLYELINPFNPYTFLAPEDNVARCVGIVLGRGFFPVIGPDGELVLPFLGNGWATATYRLMGADFDKFSRDHAEDIVRSLDSLVIGTRDERGEVDQKLAQVRARPRPEDSAASAEEDAQAYLEAWHRRRFYSEWGAHDLPYDLRAAAQNQARRIRGEKRDAAGQG